MKHIAACNLAKTTLTHWCFLRFLNSRNGTKLRKAPLIVFSDELTANAISSWFVALVSEVAKKSNKIKIQPVL